MELLDPLNFYSIKTRHSLEHIVQAGTSEPRGRILFHVEQNGRDQPVL